MDCFSDLILQEKQWEVNTIQTGNDRALVKTEVS